MFLESKNPNSKLSVKSQQHALDYQKTEKQTIVVDKCLLKVNTGGSNLVSMEILLMSLLEQ